MGPWVAARGAGRRLPAGGERGVRAGAPAPGLDAGDGTDAARRVVLTVDGDGRATSVMTVAEMVWIRTDLLTVAAPGEPPCTGDRLSLADEVIVDEGGRRLMVA